MKAEAAGVPLALAHQRRCSTDSICAGALSLVVGTGVWPKCFFSRAGVPDSPLTMMIAVLDPFVA